MTAVNEQTNLKRAALAASRATFLVVLLLSGCKSFSGPTKQTYRDVPDSDFALLDQRERKLTHWNSSFDRARASKLTYKQFVFYPPAESEQMEADIRALPIKDILAHLDKCKCSGKLTLLHDHRVLVSGRSIENCDASKPSTDIQMIDPKLNAIWKLGDLQVPRRGHTVVELKDGRVIFIGGDTLPKFADDGTDSLTNTVEALNVQTGKTKIIGRISVPRDNVIGEPISDRQILIVGGWNEYGMLKDYRYWPGAEIFLVPEKKADE